MIRFILNNKAISTNLSPGMILVDFIRYHQGLMGTKIGCREGDCGACTILAGSVKDDELRYRSYTSCLTPLGNAHGKHIITVEGVNMDKLNPVQQVMCDESATQCGFCTPGFVVSLAGFCLSGNTPSTQQAIAAIDGNICRCTGYKSIERAAEKLTQFMQRRQQEEPIAFLTRNEVLPSYMLTIKERLKKLASETNGQLKEEDPERQIVGGGTDLYVQQHDEMQNTNPRFLSDHPGFGGITREGNTCVIGASATVTDLVESPLMLTHFPGLKKYMRLISSTPIRNMATVAGNLINASPIGDLTIFFLALDATIAFSDGETSRELPLRKLYKGYKTLDKKQGEFIKYISFELPGPDAAFNFEKVSKRTHLDIASVNTAMLVSLNNGCITKVHISAGGVAPVPAYLEKTGAFLTGKLISEELVVETAAIAQAEVKPVSDARGTAAYKRLLLSQLIKAHFITLFPQLKAEQLLSS